MSGAVITGAFVMTSVGAFYLLSGKFEEYGRIFVRVGVVAGLIFSVLQLFPTGDGQGRMIAENQPVTLAAMEALFETQPGAPLVLIGQPNVDQHKIDNPLVIPNALSFLTYRAWKAEVKGLNAFPEDQWPSNIALLYFSYHIMVGLGTIFIAISVVAAFLLWRGKLFSSPWMLWILLLALPFPYIANTAGWMTAEIGRLFKNSLSRERHVHPAGIHGHVHSTRHPVPVPGPPRNRTRPRSRNRITLVAPASRRHTQ
jgi:cytochrome d ubiquinol oxidase subunit I